MAHRRGNEPRGVAIRVAVLRLTHSLLVLPQKLSCVSQYVVDADDSVIMLAACKILGSPAPDNTTYKNSIGDGREIFSGCRAYVEAWNLSRRCGGQDFDRLKGSRLALGARHHRYI